MSPTNHSNPEPPFVTGRRSTRVPAVVSVTIRGIDATGQAFKENTWTIGINKQGAKIATLHPLRVGTQILILNPVLGRSARAQVIWIGERRYHDDPYEIGIELIDAVNVWDVKYPPEDWLRGIPIGPEARRPEAASPASPPPSTAGPSASELARASEPSKAAAAPAPAKELAPHLAKPGPSHVPPWGPPREAEQPGPPGATRPEPSPTPSANLSLPIDTQIEARLQEVEKQLTQLEEKKQAAGFIEERLTALADRLLSSRESLEATLGKAQELQKGWKSGVEEAQRSIRQAAQEALEAAAPELGERLRKETEAASAKLTEETSKRIQEESSASLQALSRDATDRLARSIEEFLSKLTPQLQARQTQAIEQAREQLVVVVQTAAADLTEKLRKIADEMKAALAHEIEKSLEAENYPRRLAEMSNSALESFRQKMAALVEAHVQEAGEKHLESIRNQLRKEFSTASEDARAAIKTQLEQVLKEACDRVYRQVGVGTIVLKDWADRTRAQLDAFLEESAGAFQKRVAEISSVTLEKNRKEAEVLLEEFQGRLQKAARVFQKKGTESLETPTSNAPPSGDEPARPKLRPSTEDYLDLVIDQLRETPQLALHEEAEAFRKKLAEALAWFHHGTKDPEEKNS